MTKFEIIKKIAQIHDDLKAVSDAVVSLPTQECVSPVSDEQAILLQAKYSDKHITMAEVIEEWQNG
jgi:hypothetical protein